MTTTVYEARINRDLPAMARWYPQFNLVVPLVGNPYWHGVVQPFRSCLVAFRIAFVYRQDDRGVPTIWCLSPEISKRTHWSEPHINANGTLCTYFVPDRTFDQEKHDISSLVDLTVDWTRRFIYFTEFGYWPGKEAPHSAIDVLAELDLNRRALCVCGNGRLFYSCCRPVYAAAAAIERAQIQKKVDDARLQRVTGATLCEIRRRLGPIGMACLTPGLGPPADLLELYCRNHSVVRNASALNENVLIAAA